MVEGTLQLLEEEMHAIKWNLEDWPEWVRPYTEEKEFLRRKNQYGTERARYSCFSVKSVPFSVMLENAKSKTLKWDVRGTCRLCGGNFHGPWSNIWIRKRYRGDEVCGRCVRKAAYTDEWRENNSKSQRISQGSPQARKRMSRRLKMAHNNDPSISKRISAGLKRAYHDNPEFRRKVAAASRKNWERPEYQEKVTGHGYHHGYYISGDIRIYFASSWELMFLDWCGRSEDVVSFDRCVDKIPYSKPSGGTARYFPDFVVEWANGTKSVVEIKGGRQKIGLVERKRVAAESFYEGLCEYIILFKEDLKRMGIFKESKRVGDWIDKLESESKVAEHAKGKSSKSSST